MNKWLAGGVVGIGLVFLTFGGWNMLTGSSGTSDNLVKADQGSSATSAQPTNEPVVTNAPATATTAVPSEITSAPEAVQPPPEAEAAEEALAAAPAVTADTEPQPEVDSASADTNTGPATSSSETVSAPEPNTEQTEEVLQAALPSRSSTEAPAEIAPAEPQAEVDPTPEQPVVQPEATATTESNQEAELVKAKEQDPTLPRFDLVRVDADGQTIIAGKATPGEKVDILLDGEVIGEAEADGTGAFVGIVTARLSGNAQQLQLRTRASQPETEPEAESNTVVEVTTEPKPELAASDREQPSGGDAAKTEAESKEDLSEEVTAIHLDLAREENAAEETSASTPEAGEAETAGDDTEPSVPGVTPTATNTPEATETVEIQPKNTDQETVAAAEVTEPEVEPAPVTQAPEAQQTPAAEVAPSANAGSAETQLARAEPEQPATPEAGTITVEDQPSYALSAPVIILPSTAPDAAPALVQPKEDQVALLQPQGAASSVTLDAIRYGETGAVQLNGRGHPGNSVRIYGNGDRLGDTGITDSGTWAWALARERALGIRLFRFDELDLKGTVASRIETPFTYEALSPKIVRQREVVIQRGNNLWTIAEQYYGEGLRFSVIYGANSDLIRDPDLIYPGQVFSVPELVDAE